MVKRIFSRRRGADQIERDAVDVRALVGQSDEPLVLTDPEGTVLAASASTGLEPGRRLSAKEDGAAYEELRSGFTAVVSHELRTPLARLLALLETALLPDSDSDELVELARAEVAQIGELIDDVLFLSELETGREVVSLGSTRALPVLEEAVHEVRERADRAGVTVQAQGDASIDLPLRAPMLRAIAQNTAANAVRYPRCGARSGGFYAAGPRRHGVRARRSGGSARWEGERARQLPAGCDRRPGRIAEAERGRDSGRRPVRERAARRVSRRLRPDLGRVQAA